MSGHSKWSTIKRQKGAADIKRGKTFTKIANAITIAVKQGGGVDDPAQNPKLRLAVDMARVANMPKDNIERAIKRAKSKGEGDLSEVIYEGFGPGGISIIVEAATDNTNRTTSEVKNLFSKHNIRFASPGATSHLFKQRGEITIDKKDKTIDDIFLTAADMGAEDVVEEGDVAFVYTDIQNLSQIKDKLKSTGFEVLGADIIRKPESKIAIDISKSEKYMKFINELEDMDDVQKVYSNAETGNQ